MEILIIKKAGKLKVGAVKKVSQQVGELFISRGIAKKVGDDPEPEPDKVVYSTIKVEPGESKEELIAAKLKEFKAAENKSEKRRLRKELDELKK